MNLRPEEISSVIKEQIKNYSVQLETADVVLFVSMDWKVPCRASCLRFQMMYMEWS